jgi:endonuclease G
MISNIKYFKVTLVMLFISFIGYSQSDLPRVINFDDQIIEHTAYTLSYNETCEQPNWVKYMVTKEDLDSNVAKRKNNFKIDEAVVTGSAELMDYKGSGYDRGHLAPAATFVDSQKEMDESFYMSNMSPQHPSFNRGVWKKIESYERKIAVEKDTVYVITGPILTDGLKTIGPNKVCVPEMYYKIIYTSDWQIGFIVKNEKSSDPLYTFNQPIEIIQREAKINFNIK